MMDGNISNNFKDMKRTWTSTSLEAKEICFFCLFVQVQFKNYGSLFFDT